MRKFLRLAVGASCLVGLGLPAVALDPDGPLLRSFQECLTASAAPAEDSERLKRWENAMRRRKEAKDRVTEQIIAGRISLAEAIKQFRDVDRQWPDERLMPLKVENLGVSEDEWDGRRVILSVQIFLVDRPDEADAVVGRLQMELQELLASRPKRSLAPAEPWIEEGSR